MFFYESDYPAPLVPERIPGDYYNRLFPIFRGALDMRYSRVVHNPENIWTELPAIYVSNHVRAVDSLLITLAVGEETGKPIRFGAKQEYFVGKGINNQGKLGRTAKWLMDHTGQIPVLREGRPREIVEAFQVQSALTGAALDRGESVGYHGEGTRIYDGRVHKFRTGIAKIAVENHVPLIPTAIRYGNRLGCGRIGVDIIFGEAIVPDALRYRDGISDLSRAAFIRHITDLTEERVAEMLGAERSGEYASFSKGGSNEPSTAGSEE